jgi:hypothetical protein
LSGSSWFHENLVESRNRRGDGFENGERDDEACHEGVPTSEIEMIVRDSGFKCWVAIPKRRRAEGQFDNAASAQLASQLTLRPPLTGVCAISIPGVHHLAVHRVSKRSHHSMNL